MRLNGWQKWGIALSILWAVTAAIQTHSEDVERANNFIKFSYKACTDSKIGGNKTDLSSCEEKKAIDIETWMKGSNMNVAVTALAPIPFIWFAGFILVYLLRIQVSGFRTIVPWPTFSKVQKAATIFCALSLGAGLLFVSMIIMNLYVDMQVPVTLSPFMDVMKIGDDRVLVKGTWTRHGAAAGSDMGEPIQTSTIDCQRSENRCTEARASLYKNLLSSDVIEHDVQSWTDQFIVIKNIDVCSEEIYTIDLKTKTVSGLGRQINTDITICKPTSFKSEETEWNYRMESGFPIYLGLRKKARPWPLRILQPFFGN